jgi:hypothetical protein
MYWAKIEIKRYLSVTYHCFWSSYLKIDEQDSICYRYCPALDDLTRHHFAKNYLLSFLVLTIIEDASQDFKLENPPCTVF